MENATEPGAISEGDTGGSGDGLSHLAIAVIAVACLSFVAGFLYVAQKWCQNQEQDVEKGKPTSLPYGVPIADYTKKEISCRVLEALNRATFIFPRLQFPRDPRCYRSSNAMSDLQGSIKEALGSRIDELSKDAADWASLSERENAVKMCIALGMNETMVTQRFKAIRTFEAEFGIRGKVPTLDQIWYLVDTLHIDNPFGDDEYIDGSIHKYQGEEWLQYLGVNMKQDTVKETIREVERVLRLTGDGLQLDKTFAHGTTGSSLNFIYNKNFGYVPASVSPIGSKHPESGHDFGDGIYAFNGENLKYAISWAVDHTWFWFSGEGLLGRNPAVILFRKPPHTNKRYYYDVDNARRFTREHVKRNLKPKIFKNLEDTYPDLLENWSTWHQYVKLNRSYKKDLKPPGARVVYGKLHHPDRTGEVDTRRLKPVADEGGWIQYCFKPGKGKQASDDDNLGNDKIFIEINMDWSEWLKYPNNDHPTLAEMKEAHKLGKEKGDDDDDDVAAGNPEIFC